MAAEKNNLHSSVDPHDEKSLANNELLGRQDSEQRDDKPCVDSGGVSVREQQIPADSRPLLLADLGVVGGGGVPILALIANREVGGGVPVPQSTNGAPVPADVAATTTAGAIPAAKNAFSAAASRADALVLKAAGCYQKRRALVEFLISNEYLETAHGVEQDYEALGARRRLTLKRRWVPIFLLALLASLFVQFVDLTNLTNLPNLLPGQGPVFLSSFPLDETPSSNPPLRLTQKAWFAHGGRQFEGPTDDLWIETSGQAASEVTYLTNHTQIRMRGGKGNCTGALEVFSWIMNQVNARGGCLMVAYGQLLHLNREADFVNKEGVFYDDDIDTWAPPATFAHIATLERQLFEKFGWTIRVFLKDNYVVLGQIIASCGHPVLERPGKAASSEPAIEMYPMFTIAREGNETQHGIVKDIWGGTQFPLPMLFPTIEKTLDSAGIERPLKLQVPNQPLKILDCLYGNWRLPSPGRQGTAFKHCGLP